MYDRKEKGPEHDVANMQNKIKLFLIHLILFSTAVATGIIILFLGLFINFWS